MSTGCSGIVAALHIGSGKRCKTKGYPRASGEKQRRKTVKYDKRRDKRCNRIEIMSGRLDDWRRVAPDTTRCRKVFL